MNTIALAADHFEPRRGSNMGRFSGPANTRQQHRVLGARNCVVVLANRRVIGIGASAAPHRMGRRCGTDPAKTHGGRPASTERGATQPGAALLRACCMQAGGCREVPTDANMRGGVDTAMSRARRRPSAPVQPSLGLSV